LTACASARDDRAEVRAAVDAVVSGLSHLDADATVAPFADDATVFFPDSAGVPQRVEGKPAIRDVFARFMERVRAGGTTSMTLHAEDERVDLAGDSAIVTFHIKGPILSRRTFVLRRIGGVWRVVHLHASNVRVSS
jgi:ketosteroid isomerase-like protein